MHENALYSCPDTREFEHHRVRESFVQVEEQNHTNDCTFSVTGRLTLNVNFGVQQTLVPKTFSDL
jgi:hypothetical protein